MQPQIALRVPAQSQTFTMAPTTVSRTMVGGEGKENTNSPIVQLYVPTQPLQQVMMLDRNSGQIPNKSSTTNSSRWTDTETRCLLELWRVNYRHLKGKKRNFQEWDMIAKEFNRRIGHCALGPRTGNQCKVRIKNLSADYKKARDQNQPFAYHELMHELIENKELSLDIEEAAASDLFQIQSSSVVPSTPKETRAKACTPLNMVTLQSAPGTSTPLNTCVAAVSNTHVTQQAEVTSQARPIEDSDPDSSEEESPSEAEYVHGKRSAVSSVRELIPRKKPRKNPRPTKLIHSHEYHEEVSVVAIMREFLEDSRKREEDLFKHILQHQLQAERRYQEFTLEVVKEIGKLYKRD